MEQVGLKYTRPYLDMEYRRDGKELNEWENNHPLNRLKLHVRQVHSVLEHVDQLISELEDERDRAIDDVIALHSENRKLKRMLDESRKQNGSVAGKPSSTRA